MKKALLYAIVAMGHNPRIASERIDSGEQRVAKICELIESAELSIHDLSRIAASKKGEFSRMNMPFELGVDYGCRTFAAKEHGHKRFLIVARRSYDYIRALSDLSGVDIEAHSNDPQVLIRKVRNWLVSATGDTTLPAPAVIWYDHGDFNADLYDTLKSQGFSDDDIDELPVVEYLDHLRRWIDGKAA